MPRKKYAPDPASPLTLDGPPPFQGTMLTMMDIAGLTARSWNPWRTFWRAVFALPMSPSDRARYEFHTGRRRLPRKRFREVWMPIGRGAGKSWNAALAGLFFAISRDYRGVLPPGGVAMIPIVGADQKQARLVLGYIKGLTGFPEFAKYVEDEPLADSITFTTGARIEIKTASYRTIRGFTIPALIADEIAFWRSDDSAEPDAEILNAARPGMGRLKGSMMLALSSPYAKKGELYRAVRDSYGHDISRTLVWNADTLSMNPAYADKEEIANAFEEDPTKAASEYGTGGHVAFRADVESFVDINAVAAVVVEGRHALPRAEGLRYYAFTDPSGGSQDAWTLAVTHSDSGKPILDALAERQPPFSPAAVVRDYAEILRAYGISEVEGDHYGGEFPRELFRKQGITYRPADRPKSDLYREWLPLLNAGNMELLDIPRLKTQLCGLERKVSRAGEDSITHAPGGHDDMANAAAGGLVLAARKRPLGTVRFAI